MDDLFWYQAYGDKQEALAVTDDEDLKHYIKNQQRPWPCFSTTTTISLISILDPNS